MSCAYETLVNLKTIFDYHYFFRFVRYVWITKHSFEYWRHWVLYRLRELT